MQYFAILINFFFFRAPRFPRLPAAHTTLCFVVVSAGPHRQEANYSEPRRQSASAFFQPGFKQHTSRQSLFKVINV